MELTASEVWSRLLDAARRKLPDQSFRTWLAGTSAIALTEDSLLVEAPTEFHVEWIEDKHGAMLSDLSEHLFGRRLELSFRAHPEGEATEIPTMEVTADAPEVAGGEAPPKAPGRPASLNERYTFDRFVVGGSNQLAAAAARAVAENPARIYNPLFLYGGVGLGKTHLMHAIGNAILDDDPSSRVAYVPTEQFMNELVTAIQEGTTAAFRRKYRRMDLLLVDDVHFLEGKERTQEEFFHTFNALYDAHHQIVVTSDRPPKEMAELEQRLVSRFEWGLVADIKTPDYETRVAILRKKAEDDDLVLDDEVIDFIARAFTSSVRELEGAVIKLLAYSSLTHQDVTVDLARTALRPMIDPESMGTDRELTLEEIRRVVADRWDVTPEGLCSKRRTKDLTVPRQVAMYLIREILETSLAEIGEHFGGRDHSTVIHSIRKVEETMEEDEEFEADVRAARRMLQRSP